MKFNALYNLIIENDYRGEHGAPEHDSGDPMFNVCISVYPSDFYGPEGYRMYSQGFADDGIAYSIIRSVHNRPKARVKVFRAVPKILTNEEQIWDYLQQKKYILKYGKIPPNADRGFDNKSRYYDYLNDRIAYIEKLPPEEDKKKLTINKGDWVGITRSYAKEHGESNLNNKYKILTKTVYAKDLFTTGDSLQEWGYDPQ